MMLEVIKKYPLTLSISSLIFWGCAITWAILSPETPREKIFSLLGYFMGAFAAVIISTFVNNLKKASRNQDRAPDTTGK
jgi:hypothetical protein